MPRRSAAQPTADVDQNHSSSLPLPSSSSEDLRALRTNWKWAAFSQFFYTFSPLFAMNDVSINDIEEDLLYGRSIFIPRVMVRLLFVLTYDRKVSLDNWQTALRKQYNKRDPMANPIGPEPPSEPQDDDYVTPEPSVDMKTEEDADGNAAGPSSGPESARGGSVKEEEDIAPRPLAKKYHYLVDEIQAAELDQRETKNWLELPMFEKLDSMHLLTEWQFHNPTRVRTMMKTDDEVATWRIEPIGYDAKRNAYWLIGSDRLWIQREPPRPPRPTTSLKRKRAEPATKSTRSSASSKRQRVQTNSSSKGKGKGKSRAPPPAANGRSGRAAKAQANIKLDAQAKQLAELNRQAALAGQLNSSRSRSTDGRLSAKASRPLGTRISARLRGQEDEEWQTVPDEWLNEDETSEDGDAKEAQSGKPALPKTGLESDEESISDLTELSDDSKQSNNQDTSSSDDDGEGNEPPSQDPLQPEEPTLPVDFIEWETICVTLQEWENIAERWKNATYYAEKALYKVLTKHYIPAIIEDLREMERKRTVEEAVVHRKRSSRIAVKEQAKEEARQVARRKAEEEERMGRARRAEARHLAQEAERQRREHKRHDEEDEDEDTAKGEENASQDVHVDIIGEDSAPKDSRSHQQDPVLLTPQRPTASTSGSRTPSDWELDCEICLRKGMNIDDGIPIMCCESCSKWQHISCHDRADHQAGRPRRNWEKEEFICRQCRLRRAASGQHLHTSAISLRIPPASAFQHPVSYNPYVAPQNYMSTTYGQAAPAPPSKSISFSHYHPHQRGFSTINHTPYNSTSATQSYSQLASQHQYQEVNGQIPYSHVAPTNGWNAAPAMEIGYPYTPGYSDMNGHWMPQQPPNNNASTQFKYHPASYQAHS